MVRGVTEAWCWSAARESLSRGVPRPRLECEGVEAVFALMVEPEVVVDEDVAAVAAVVVVVLLLLLLVVGGGGW